MTKNHLTVILLTIIAGCSASTDSPEIALERGNILLSQSRYEDAIATYDKVADALPERAALFFSRGLCYERLGLNEKAFADYSECLKLDDQHVDAMNNRGVVLANLKRYDEAAKQFSALITLLPENVLALRNRGLCYHDLGRFADALADYNRGIDIAPDDAETWFQRGNLYLEQDEMSDAVADYSHAIKLNESHAKAWMNRGVARYRLGELVNAMKDLEQAQLLDDNIVIPGIDWAKAGSPVEVVAARPILEPLPIVDDWSQAIAFATDVLNGRGFQNIEVSEQFLDQQCARLTAKSKDSTAVVYLSLAPSNSVRKVTIPAVVPATDTSEQRLLLVLQKSDTPQSDSEAPFVILSESSNWQPDTDKLEPLTSRLSLD